MKTGAVATTESAQARPQFEPWAPVNPEMTTGKVTALVRVNTTANRNSVQAKMKAKTVVAISPGSASGSVILAKAQRRVAPSIIALSSISTGTLEKYDRIIHNTKGRLKTA